MKLLMLGSAVYSKDMPNDIDCLADMVKGHTNEVVDGALATSYIFRCGNAVPLEIHIPKPGTAWERILQRFGGYPVKDIPLPVEAALKKAHLILPTYKWERTMRHYIELKGLLGCKEFNPDEHDVGDIFRHHRSECLAMAKPHPKLDTSKDQFFGKEVYDILDHDSLHEAVAFGNEPMYKRYLVDEVQCDKKLWDKIDLEDKIRAVAEEASVLSLERSLIPFIYLNRDYWGDEATFRFALQKICTTITSGWFREFAIEYYEEAAQYYNRFRPAFFKAWKEGKIKVSNQEVVNGK